MKLEPCTHWYNAFCSGKALTIQALHYRTLFFALEREGFYLEHICSGTGKLSLQNIFYFFILLWNGKAFTQRGTYLFWNGKAFTRRKTYFLWNEKAFTRRGIDLRWNGKAFTRRGTYFPWNGKAFTRRGIYLPWNGKAFTRRGIFLS